MAHFFYSLYQNAMLKARESILQKEKILDKSWEFTLILFKHSQEVEIKGLKGISCDFFLPFSSLQSWSSKQGLL